MAKNRPPNRKKRRAAKFSGIAAISEPLQSPPSIQKTETPVPAQSSVGLRPLREVPRSIVKWLRSISVGTCLLGPVVGGLVPVAFYPITTAFYVGLVILALDLAFLEIWPSIAKACVIATLVFWGVGYWIRVVSHPDPISFGYLIENGQLDVKINNESPDDDYRDVDLTIVPDDRFGVFIGSAQPISNIEGCSLISSIPDQVSAGETVLVWADPNPQLHYAYLSNQLRIHCQDLPRMSHESYIIHLVFSIPAKGGSPPPSPIHAERPPSVTGGFTGKFRVFKIQTVFKPV